MVNPNIVESMVHTQFFLPKNADNKWKQSWKKRILDSKRTAKKSNVLSMEKNAVVWVLWRVYEREKSSQITIDGWCDDDDNNNFDFFCPFFSLRVFFFFFVFYPPDFHSRFRVCTIFFCWCCGYCWADRLFLLRSHRYVTFPYDSLSALSLSALSHSDCNFIQLIWNFSVAIYVIAKCVVCVQSAIHSGECKGKKKQTWFSYRLL